MYVPPIVHVSLHCVCIEPPPGREVRFSFSSWKDAKQYLFFFFCSWKDAKHFFFFCSWKDAKQNIFYFSLTRKDSKRNNMLFGFCSWKRRKTQHVCFFCSSKDAEQNLCFCFCWIKRRITIRFVLFLLIERRRTKYLVFIFVYQMTKNIVFFCSSKGADQQNKRVSYIHMFFPDAVHQGPGQVFHTTYSQED